MREGTLARLFQDRVTRYGDRPAQRIKAGGAWTDVSWRALGDEVREVARPQGGPGFGGPPQGQRGQRPDPEQFEKMRKEQDEKILAVLTDKQLVQWNQMLGKKFEFERR